MPIEQHIMVDIETLGMNPVEHPMIQLAGVVFDPITFEATEDHSNFKSNLTIPSTKSIHLPTLKWWLKTDPVALAEILDTRIESNAAMTDFALWLPEAHCYLWAKPTTFDCTFIFHYLKEFAYIPTRMHYRQVIDVRSYLRGRGFTGELPEGKPQVEGKAHDALWDCYEQLDSLRQVEALLLKQALEDIPEAPHDH